MKKAATLVTILILALALAACGGGDTEASEPEVSDTGFSIDYGASDIYSQEDMDAAIQVITAEFDSWEGCELHKLAYAGDECNSEENVRWLNELKEGQAIAGEEFTQCMEFISSFHSPVEGGGAWEADAEYTDWQWWLARTEGGDWYLLTWGY